MKKVVAIIVLGLLWCNVGVAEKFITFKNCYSTDEGQKSIEDDERFDEHTYDIDKTKKNCCSHNRLDRSNGGKV